MTFSIHFFRENLDFFLKKFDILICSYIFASIFSKQLIYKLIFLI